MNKQPKALRLADALSGTPDCNCAAWSANECACDAVWPEHFVTEAAAELRRLHAENETLRKDAERYRWLRDGVFVDGEINEDMYVHADTSLYPTRWALVGDELDEAVDTAMKGQS